MSDGYPAAAPEEGCATAVLLCHDLRTVGLDLAELGERLNRDSTSNVRVEIVHDLCNHPHAVGEAAAAGASRVVLGLCSRRMAESEVHHHARRAALDPFGVEIVNLGVLCAVPHPTSRRTEEAASLLAAAVAKVEAFRGAGPANVRPRLLREGQRVSRRALFTLPPLRYEPVAAVRHARCASEAGCDLCVRVCPRNALAIEDGRVAVAKGACDACGICVSECPRGAVDLAGASLPQIEAELGALLRPSTERSTPKAILFACRSGLAALEEMEEAGRVDSGAWLPVRVPCAGMIRPGWLLQSLSHGAAAVGVLACRDDCAFGQQEAVEERVEYCRLLLERLGDSPDRIELFDPNDLAGLPAIVADLEPATSDRDTPVLREPKATALAISRLGAGKRGIEAGVSHPGGPLGVVRIETAGCTACEACAHVCPTEAMTSRSEGDRVSLEFDPTACNACGLCEQSCPESVIQVTRVTDPAMLAVGRAELHADVVARCETCGAKVAPGAMVQRVTQLLGDGNAGPATLAALRRCATCRGMGVAART